MSGPDATQVRPPINAVSGRVESPTRPRKARNDLVSRVPAPDERPHRMGNLQSDLYKSPIANLKVHRESFLTGPALGSIRLARSRAPAENPHLDVYPAPAERWER